MKIRLFTNSPDKAFFFGKLRTISTDGLVIELLDESIVTFQRDGSRKVRSDGTRPLYSVEYKIYPPDLKKAYYRFEKMLLIAEKQNG
jgi:hypothetical protein